MRRSSKVALWFVVAILTATPVRAAPRSIEDCEAIKEANAYNLCLASFGPMRGQRAKSYPGTASPESKAGGKPAGGAGHRTSRAPMGGALLHGARGRIRMQFTPRGR